MNWVVRKLGCKELSCVWEKCYVGMLFVFDVGIFFNAFLQGEIQILMPFCRGTKQFFWHFFWKFGRRTSDDHFKILVLSLWNRYLIAWRIQRHSLKFFNLLSTWEQTTNFHSSLPQRNLNMIVLKTKIPLRRRTFNYKLLQHSEPHLKAPNHLALARNGLIPPHFP